jgi:hypothetical protein
MPIPAALPGVNKITTAPGFVLQVLISKRSSFCGTRQKAAAASCPRLGTARAQ